MDEITQAARAWAEETYPADAWSELVREQAMRAFNAGWRARDAYAGDRRATELQAYKDGYVEGHRVGRIRTEG